METLVIIGLTTFLGYTFNKQTQQENISPLEKEMDPSKKPNSMNIYNSNRVNEVDDTILDQAMKLYEQSQNPKNTGVLPPIYNSYSAHGNLDLTKKLIDPNLAKINDINRYQNPIKKSEPGIEKRPMFNLELQSNEVTNYSEIEKSNEQVSLLTGKPIERDHNNMVPFFGSTVKQNMEKFANVTKLDLNTGNTDTFFHKKEVTQRFSNQPENIYGGPLITQYIDTDRYIPSLYKEGEKPFYEERIAAPIAGTFDNKIRDAAIPRGIDELRVANKPQISYKTPEQAGQIASLRGVQSDLVKNRPDTYYEQGQDRLFTNVGAIERQQSDYNFENIQSTNRQSQNLEYYGTAQLDQKTKPRYSNCDINTVDACYKETYRQQFKPDTNRNFDNKVPIGNDIDRNSYNLPELERNSTSTMHIVNINNQGRESTMGLFDEAQTTNKQTTLLKDYNGILTNGVKNSDILPLELGMIDITAKTTQKQMNLNKNYVGQANKGDQTGYDVANYDMKTTNKETTTGYMHLKPGHTQGFSEKENREQYKNAEISNTQEQLLLNSRENGPQTFRISGSKNVIGHTYTKRNNPNPVRTNNKDNISSVIHNKESLGQLTHEAHNRFGEYENKRLDIANDINGQLHDNPFYNIKRT